MLDSEQNLNGIKKLFDLSSFTFIQSKKKKKKIHGVHRKRRGLGIGAFTLKDSRRKSLLLPEQAAGGQKKRITCC